ncbi:MAG: shikimate 5-dehydrogenase [Lautropia sp.]|nr:shikimate 5-dehydrogenase [Lautropia sp.]
MQINKDTQLCMSLAGRPGNFGTRFHNYLYQKLGLNFIYKAFTTTDIEHAVKGVRALGIRGCAVSMPFKESCMPFLDEITPSARAIESVNTIVNTDGRLVAYNTDYIAIATLIERHGLDRNASVIVRGSGGMAKAVVAAFRDKGFSRLKVYARNGQTGRHLAALYGYQHIDSLAKDPADILVNVTPIGMQGGPEADEVAYPEAAIAAASVVFDVVALPPDTPLIRRARALGKPVISGAEVIVLQAVEQFALYTGVRPDEKLMAEAAAFARSAG